MWPVKGAPTTAAPLQGVAPAGPLMVQDHGKPSPIQKYLGPATVTGKSSCKIVQHGNDQPHLAADLIKNKVNSSIMHLYEAAPRLVARAFTEVARAHPPLSGRCHSRNFARGHNPLTLHGIYYSPRRLVECAALEIRHH